MMRIGLHRKVLTTYQHLSDIEMINKFLLDCKEPKNTDFFSPQTI